MPNRDSDKQKLNNCSITDIEKDFLVVHTSKSFYSSMNQMFSSHKKPLIGGAILSVILILSVSVSVSLASPQPQRRRQQLNSGFGKDPVSLEEVVSNVFRHDSWNATWVSDTEYIYRNRGGLQIFSVVSAQSQTIMPNSELGGVFRYWLSPDQRYVLLALRPQRLFRHSFIAIYEVYNIRTGQKTSLQPDESTLAELREKQEQAGLPGGPPRGGPPGGGQGPPGGPGPAGGNRPPPQLPLLYATWAPTGNALAFVFSNNVFYRNSPEDVDSIITVSGKTSV